MTQEALKLALEAMESVTVECNNFHHPKKDQNHHWAKCPPVAKWDKAITAIKEALEQTQEPFCLHWEDRWGCNHYADPKEPHPVNAKPLYTTPPQRLPLTDEDLKKIWYAMRNIMGWYSFQEIARAIEAAHNIKGNT
jgi:hypothetical protein